MRVFFPNPERMIELGYQKLAYVPFLVGEDGSYPAEANRYLGERACLEWQPSAGEGTMLTRFTVRQTVQSRDAMARRLMEFLHPDHLNTPRLATDSTQSLLWRWDSDAYGLGAPNEDVDGDGKATSVPLRFPGQIYDAQTQLSYNYYRDYNPATGRYVQSDPIGLNGGLNTYGYVEGNAVNYADPTGLKVVFEEGAPGIEQLKNTYALLKQRSSTGARLCGILEQSPDTYTLTTTGSHGVAWYNGPLRTIRIDPQFRPLTNTVEGNLPADPLVVLGHEIGHAATKTWDDGPNNMNNIKANENPIRQDLGLPARTSYNYNPQGN